jgi:hypothetical protein
MFIKNTDFVYIQWVIKAYLCSNANEMFNFYALKKAGEVLLTKNKALQCQPA